MYNYGYIQKIYDYCIFYLLIKKLGHLSMVALTENLNKPEFLIRL